MNTTRCNTRAYLLGSAALLGLALGEPASAQVQAEQQAQAAQNANDPATSGSSNDEVEIVVTAQKRTEDQQDVPVSISVVSGQDLVKSGATQLTEIAGYVPGLHVSSLGAPGQTQVSLRGIVPLAAGASVASMSDAHVGSSVV